MGIPILGDVINAVKDLVSEVVVDKDKKNELNVRLQELEDQANARYHEEVMGQIDVNKVEAASGSVFVAGGRPAIIWVGAASLAYQYIVSPFIGIWTKVPAVDTAGLYNILIAILGVGAMRTYEKVKGVSTNDYTDVPKAVQPVETKTETTVSVVKETTSKPKRKFRL